MLDHRTVVQFCAKHKISIEAFFFAYILFLDKRQAAGVKLYNLRPSKIGTKSERPLSYIYMYAEQGPDWDPEAIKMLLEKGFIVENPYDTERERRSMGGKPYYIPDAFDVTAKFAEAIMATESRFEEFWEEYPATIPGFDDPRQRVRLKAVVKEEVESLYYRRIGSRVAHEELMMGLRWAKDNNRINCNILKYLSGENWKADLEEMEAGVNTGSTVI